MRISPMRRRPAWARASIVTSSSRSAVSGSAFGYGRDTGLARRRQPNGAEARQRPGGLRRVGDRRHGRKSLGREAGFSRRDHALLTAEEMCGAGDVEKQPIGGIERRQGREAAAPGEKMVERRSLTRRIGFGHPQVRADGARIGEAHAGPNGASSGSPVYRRNPLGPFDGGHSDQRGLLFGRAFPTSIEPVGRERRHRKGEDARHAAPPCPSQVGRPCGDGSSGA